MIRRLYAWRISRVKQSPRCGCICNIFVDEYSKTCPVNRLCSTAPETTFSFINWLVKSFWCCFIFLQSFCHVYCLVRCKHICYTECWLYCSKSVFQCCPDIFFGRILKFSAFGLKCWYNFRRISENSFI